jgi:hypothetical protein
MGNAPLLAQGRDGNEMSEMTIDFHKLSENLGRISFNRVYLFHFFITQILTYFTSPG